MSKRKQIRTHPLNPELRLSEHEGGYLEQLMEKAKFVAEDGVAFIEDMPVIWLVENGDRTCTMYFTDLKGREQGKRMLATLKDRFRAKKIRRYVCMVEAWVANVVDGDEFSGVRPSERPDRRDMVLIVGVERGRALNEAGEIEQTSTGRRIKAFESYSPVGGWMADMLPLED